MMTAGPTAERRGSSLLLVLILAAVAGMAVMVFFSTVRSERSRTGKLVQRTARST